MKFNIENGRWELENVKFLDSGATYGPYDLFTGGHIANVWDFLNIAKTEPGVVSGYFETVNQLRYRSNNYDSYGASFPQFVTDSSGNIIDISNKCIRDKDNSYTYGISYNLLGNGLGKLYQTNTADNLFHGGNIVSSSYGAYPIMTTDGTYSRVAWPTEDGSYAGVSGDVTYEYVHASGGIALYDEAGFLELATPTEHPTNTNWDIYNFNYGPREISTIKLDATHDGRNTVVPSYIDIDGVVAHPVPKKCSCNYGYDEDIGDLCVKCFGNGYSGLSQGELYFKSASGARIHIQDYHSSFCIDSEISVLAEDGVDFMTGVDRASVKCTLPNGENGRFYRGVHAANVSRPNFRLNHKVLQDTIDAVSGTWDKMQSNIFGIDFETAIGNIPEKPIKFNYNYLGSGVNIPYSSGYDWPANVLGFTPVSNKHIEPIINSVTHTYFGFVSDDRERIVFNNPISSIKKDSGVEYSQTLFYPSGIDNKIIGTSELVNSEEEDLYRYVKYDTNTAHSFGGLTYIDQNSNITDINHLARTFSLNGDIIYTDTSEPTSNTPFEINGLTNSNINKLSWDKWANDIGEYYTTPYDPIVIKDNYLHLIYHNDVYTSGSLVGSFGISGIKDFIFCRNHFYLKDFEIGESSEVVPASVGVARINNSLYLSELRYGPIQQLHSYQGRTAISKGYMYASPKGWYFRPEESIYNIENSTATLSSSTTFSTSYENIIVNSDEYKERIADITYNDNNQTLMILSNAGIFEYDFNNKVSNQFYQFTESGYNSIKSSSFAAPHLYYNNSGDLKIYEEYSNNYFDVDLSGTTAVITNGSSDFSFPDIDSISSIINDFANDYISVTYEKTYYTSKYPVRIIDNSSNLVLEHEEGSQLKIVGKDGSFPIYVSNNCVVLPSGNFEFILGKEIPSEETISDDIDLYPCYRDRDNNVPFLGNIYSAFNEDDGYFYWNTLHDNLTIRKFKARDANNLVDFIPGISLDIDFTSLPLGIDTMLESTSISGGYPDFYMSTTDISDIGSISEFNSGEKKSSILSLYDNSMSSYLYYSTEGIDNIGRSTTSYSRINDNSADIGISTSNVPEMPHGYISYTDADDDLMLYNDKITLFTDTSATYHSSGNMISTDQPTSLFSETASWQNSAGITSKHNIFDVLDSGNNLCLKFPFHLSSLGNDYGEHGDLDLIDEISTDEIYGRINNTSKHPYLFFSTFRRQYVYNDALDVIADDVIGCIQYDSSNQKAYINNRLTSVIDLSDSPEFIDQIAIWTRTSSTTLEAIDPWTGEVISGSEFEHPSGLTIIRPYNGLTIPCVMTGTELVSPNGDYDDNDWFLANNCRRSNTFCTQKMFVSGDYLSCYRKDMGNTGEYVVFENLASGNRLDATFESSLRSDIASDAGASFSDVDLGGIYYTCGNKYMYTSAVAEVTSGFTTVDYVYLIEIDMIDPNNYDIMNVSKTGDHISIEKGDDGRIVYASGYLNVWKSISSYDSIDKTHSSSSISYPGSPFGNIHVTVVSQNDDETFIQYINDTENPTAPVRLYSFDGTLIDSWTSASTVDINNGDTDITYDKVCYDLVDKDPGSVTLTSWKYASPISVVNGEIKYFTNESRRIYDELSDVERLKNQNVFASGTTSLAASPGDLLYTNFTNTPGELPF